MPRWLNCWIALVFAVTTSSSLAQIDYEYRPSIPKLEPQHSDRFLLDSLDNYVKFGKPTWQQGQVALKRLEGLGLDTPAGARFQIELEVELHQVQDPQVNSQTWIRLGFEDSTDMIVSWSKLHVEGKVVRRLGVYDTEGEGAEQNLVPLAVWEVPEQVSGVWTVDYSFGAVTITAPYALEGQDQPVRYDAFIKNESSWLAYMVIHQGNGSAILKRWRLQAVPRPESEDGEARKRLPD